MDQIMDYLNKIELIEELAPIVFVSFIGSCIHEYVFKLQHQQRFVFNLNIWISTIVTSIICFVIDPWIMDFNSRLIFLPPLIIGLSGMDLITKLSTLKGSIKIFEIVLSFIGLNRRTENINEDNKSEEDKYTELENSLTIFFNLVTQLLTDYYTTKNKQQFLPTYILLKKDFDNLRADILHYDTLPITLILLISSILKKMIEADSIYDKLTH